ncbi:MAG: Polyketide cyclase / dehydrase and lipid transport [Actinomycetota bacterium]|jgi:hypothetical protein
MSHSLLALREVQPLRDLQRINAAFSAATGIAMAATSSWLSRQVDIPRPVVAVLGVGLVGWSVLLVALAAQPAHRLIPASRLVAAGDATWVIGSAALILVADPTSAGALLVAAAAAAVAAFAIAGLVLGRRARPYAGDDRTEILFRSVTVAAPPSAAWHLVLDADLYAQLAPNLTRIDVAADQCSRVCTDTRGNTWTEAVRLDHERHVQRIDVDVTDHPMPLEDLTATISVHHDQDGSRIDAAFTYITRATIKGLVTSLVLPVLGRHLMRPITSGWARHATNPAATSSRAGHRP